MLLPQHSCGRVGIFEADRSSAHVLILESCSWATLWSVAVQVKRHIKRTEDNPGGIITTESPLHYSNVQLVDPVTKAPVRVTWRFLEDGSKVCLKLRSLACCRWHDRSAAGMQHALASHL